MPDEVSLGALLHLSALSFAFTAAYLGLDELRPDLDELRRGLIEVRDRVGRLLMRLDVSRGGGSKLKPIFDIPEIHALCRVAERRFKAAWYRKILYAIWSLRYVPMRKYFLRGDDRLTIGIFCAYSATVFGLLVASTLWDYCSTFWDWWPFRCLTSIGAERATFVLLDHRFQGSNHNHAAVLRR